MGQGLTSVAIGRAPVGLVALVILAQPPFSALFAWATLGETMTPQQIARRRGHPRRGAAGAAEIGGDGRRRTPTMAAARRTELRATKWPGDVRKYQIRAASGIRFAGEESRRLE